MDLKTQDDPAPRAATSPIGGKIKDGDPREITLLYFITANTNPHYNTEDDLGPNVEQLPNPNTASPPS